MTISAASHASITVDRPSRSIGSLIDDEVMVRIEPPLVMCGSTARIMRTALISVSSKAACHCASVTSLIRPPGGPPAFTSSASITPYCATAASTHA